MAWKESDARMAAFDALARLGVETPPDLDLLRFGENALYAYRDRGLVLRVARPQTRAEHVARTVDFVVRLAARGVKVAEPAAVPGVRQPVVTSTGVVTLWVYYETDPDCRVTPRELGGLLRHFPARAARGAVVTSTLYHRHDHLRREAEPRELRGWSRRTDATTMYHSIMPAAVGALASADARQIRCVARAERAAEGRRAVAGRPSTGSVRE